MISGPGTASNLQTDKTGHFGLNELSPGNYTVFSRKSGYTGPISKTYTVVLSPSCPIAKIGIPLSREALVSGRVVDAEKNPLGGLRVHISKQVFRDGKLVLTNRGESRTDAQGAYRFGGLDNGAYFIDVDVRRPEVELVSMLTEIEPVTELVHTFYPNVTSPDAASPLMLRAGEERTGVNVSMALSSTHCAGGQVSGPQKALLTVWLAIPGGYRTLTGKEIQPHQGFRICGLSEGLYRVTVGTMDSQGGTSSLVSSSFSVGRRDVDLGGLVPHPGVSLVGRVFVEGAQPGDPFPEGLLVSLVPADYALFVNEMLDALVSSTGRFAIPNVLGSEYWVQLGHLPPGYYVKAATLGSHDARRETVSPSDGQLEIRLAKDGGTVAGVLVRKDGQLAMGADVALIPEDLPPVPYRGFVNATETDQNGMFQFQAVEPGRYKLLGVSDLTESEIENPVLLRGLLTAATSVEVSANAGFQSKVIAVEAHSQ